MNQGKRRPKGKSRQFGNTKPTAGESDNESELGMMMKDIDNVYSKGRTKGNKSYHTDKEGAGKNQ